MKNGLLKNGLFKKLITGVLTCSVCLGISITPNIGISTALAEDEIIVATQLSEGSAGVNPNFVEPGGSPIYLDRENYSFEERAADMVARMTQQEKLGQMVSGYAPAIPRLGMNWWGWWSECLHGVSRYQTMAQNSGTNELWNTVSYPIPLSMGATWDPEIEYRVAQAIGEEARETADGNYRNISFYTPTVNLTRDPRWGRGDESPGEDPYQVAAIASQFVNGMEGKDMTGKLIDPNGYKQTNTTLKHYLANNTEHNRLNGSSNMDERDLREYYTDVYRRIIKSADPASVMSSYQRVNEVPSTANTHTLDMILRQTLGFSGFVTTDCDSMGELATTSGQAPYALFAWPGQGRQAGGHAWRPKALPGLAVNAAGVADAYPTSDPKNAAVVPEETIAWAALAGTDVECNSGVQGMGNNSYAGPGSGGTGGGNNAVNRGISTPMGKLTVNAIDVNVHRLLTSRMRLGEFDMKTPGVVSWYDDTRERIKENYGEEWVWNNGTNNGAPTMTQERKDLAREAAEKAIVLLRNNPSAANNDRSILPLDISNPNLKIAVIGYAADPNFGPATGGIGYVSGTNDRLQGGYSAIYGNDSFKQFVYPFKGIETAIKAANPTAEVRFTRATTRYQGVNQTQVNANEFITVTSGSVAANYDEASVRAAAEWADVCIVYAWTNLFSANEERDRGIGVRQADDNMANATLALSSGNVAMINTVKEYSNGNIVLVMETSGPNFIEDFESGIPAILFSSFNGQEKGNALANVLLGKYNPSARTSVTWFKDGQLSDLRSYKMAPGVDTLVNARETNTTNERQELDVKGRTYMYYDEQANGAVMFPFGYGKSYSSFAFSNSTISSTNVTPSQNITISLNIRNISQIDGSVVPQLYVKTPSGFGQDYPIKRLRGFQMVKLEKNETKTVTFTIPVEEFRFFNNDLMKFEVKPGTYRIQISDSSSDADEIFGWNVNVSGDYNPSVSVVTAKPVIKDADAENNIPQRLIFGVNQVVDPQLTVCMSDDSLYGFVNALDDTNTADYPFIDPPTKSEIPSTMTVTYTSNRPNVVEVSPSGVITTKAAGVATITATVTDSISGTTKTGDFIVYVSVPTNDVPLTSLKVDGEEIYVNNEDKYEIAMPRGTETAPIVTATADAAVTLAIKQAGKVPGTAFITATNAAGEAFTYSVYFGSLPVSDSLTSKNSAVWNNVINGNSTASYDANGLSFTVPRNISTFHSTSSSGNVAWPNAYLQNNISGDWIATVKVSVSSPGNGLNAGLVLYQQRTNYVAVSLQRTATTSQIRFYNAENAPTRTNINGGTGAAFTGTEAHLKLRKVGNVVTAAYSADGVAWTDCVGSLKLNGNYILPSLGVYAASDALLTVDPIVSFKDFNVDTFYYTESNGTATVYGLAYGGAVNRNLILAAYNADDKLIAISSHDLGSAKRLSKFEEDIDVSGADGAFSIKLYDWAKDTWIPVAPEMTLSEF